MRLNDKQFEALKTELAKPVETWTQIQCNEHGQWYIFRGAHNVGIAVLLAGPYDTEAEAQQAMHSFTVPPN